MSTRAVLGLIIFLVFVAAFTKPTENDFERWVSEARWQGAESGNIFASITMGMLAWRYSDHFLYATYSASLLGKEVIVCSGAFGRFSCEAAD